jgi:hypothetical protein
MRCAAAVPVRERPAEPATNGPTAVPVWHQSEISIVAAVAVAAGCGATSSTCGGGRTRRNRCGGRAGDQAVESRRRRWWPPRNSDRRQRPALHGTLFVLLDQTRTTTHRFGTCANTSNDTSFRDAAKKMPQRKTGHAWFQGNRRCPRFPGIALAGRLRPPIQAAKNPPRRFGGTAVGVEAPQRVWPVRERNVRACSLLCVRCRTMPRRPGRSVFKKASAEFLKEPATGGRGRPGSTVPGKTSS